MLKLLLLAGVLAIAGPAGASERPCPFPMPVSSAGEFKLVKVRDGVSLYERWVEVKPGLKIRELKAEFQIEAGASTAVALLQDASRASEWMQSMSRCELVEKKNQENWVTYVRYNVPWPLDDQDVLLSYRSQLKGNGLYVSFQSTEHTKHPVYSGVTRMQGVHGSWTFEPGSSGKTRVIYTIITHNKSSFPRWITDPIVQDNLLDTMSAFCAQARALHAQR